MSVRIGSRLGRTYTATSDRGGYLLHCAMMQQRSELCGDYLLQRRPGQRCQNVRVHRLCEQGGLFALTTLSFPCIAENRAPLTLDTVSAQASTSHAFCLISFLVVRSLLSGDRQTVTDRPLRNYAGVDSRELPHVVNLVQTTNLREPHSDRRDELAASLNSSPPEQVGRDNSVNQRSAIFKDHTPYVLPFQKSSRVQLPE